MDGAYARSLRTISSTGTVTAASIACTVAKSS